MKIRLMFAAVLTVALSLALLGQNAQQSYQRAVVQEQATGNLPEAIRLYSQAVKSAGEDRSLAAKALLRIAGIQEKLGQRTEAANGYDVIQKTYPEQREEAAQARIRLDALRRTSPKPRPEDVSSVTAPLFQAYCAGCHNPTNRAGGLDLGVLNAKNVGENTSVWEKILQRLRARRDPPSGQPRPNDTMYRAAISRLELALDSAYPANGPLHTGQNLAETELASRIAGFVWGGAPDASLLDDARSGKLADEAVLEQQIIRMLRDPRSSHLIANFLEPWLSMDKLQTASAEQLDAELLQAMKTETRLFLENQLRDNHNALQLWTANYTFVNDRLARHYGMPQVSGKEFRRVTWPNNTRAGVLGQAGPLTTLSFGSRTSPTKRGIFVFSRFLGMTAADPPANVPPLPETGADSGRPMRERMAAHARIPACSNCHVSFDPLGLALENFDAIGQWRTTDGGAAIDASGAFIDGTRFGGPAELRSGLLRYRDAYYSNVTQELMAFALNRKGRIRKIYDYEMPSVRAIVRNSGPRDYRWSSIIAGIVSSPPFQMKDVVP
jgi:hypothetical protein